MDKQAYIGLMQSQMKVNDYWSKPDWISFESNCKIMFNMGNCRNMSAFNIETLKEFIAAL